MFGRTVEGHKADTITIDNVSAARQVTNYLMDLGHTRIGTITGPLHLTTGRGRFDGMIEAMRARIRDKLKTATVLGFGPRFLHSTGQAYKGGPNSGVFLEITASPAKDLSIPGRKITFGKVEQAQALGDMAVLGERGRRVLRVDLGEDIEGGLKALGEAIERALS